MTWKPLEFMIRASTSFLPRRDEAIEEIAAYCLSEEEFSAIDADKPGFGVEPNNDLSAQREKPA